MQQVVQRNFCRLHQPTQHVGGSQRQRGQPLILWALVNRFPETEFELRKLKNLPPVIQVSRYKESLSQNSVVAGSLPAENTNRTITVPPILLTKVSLAVRLSQSGMLNVCRMGAEAMPRLNRTEICAAEEIQAFHLINRCVRRTYLRGRDRRSDKDYSHRTEWIRQRLEELAGILALVGLGFAVLSNHMHVVVRTRPDVMNVWSDDEVALRWWRLFPQRRNGDGSPAEPTEFELNAIRNDTSGLKEKRRRLKDIS